MACYPDRILLVLCVCQAAIPTKHAASPFSCSAVKQKLASGLTDLLDVTVAENDGLPKHVCVKCMRQLGSQKRAAKDLVNFFSQAVESYRALHHINHEG